MQFFSQKCLISTGVAEDLRTADVVNKRDSCSSVTINSVGVVSGGHVQENSNEAIPVFTAKKTTVRYCFHHIDQ